MALSPREIKDSLGRVKAYYKRNEIKRALTSAMYALQNLTMPLNMEIRSAIREAVQLIARDEQVKKCFDTLIVYQPGNELTILKQFTYAYKKIEEEEELGNYQENIDRKINLDKFFNEGIKALGNKHISEADECFMQSINFYKNEHHIFYMIANALKEAGEIRRAYPYAKRGIEALPTSEQLQELFKYLEENRK